MSVKYTLFLMLSKKHCRMIHITLLNLQVLFTPILCLISVWTAVRTAVTSFLSLQSNLFPNTKQINKTPKQNTTVFLVYVSYFLLDSFFVHFEEMRTRPSSGFSAGFHGFLCIAHVSCLSFVISFHCCFRLGTMQGHLWLSYVMYQP